jgi:pSer/pThr/pTyr-binding forkhead associated (FHA) protein
MSFRRGCVRASRTAVVYNDGIDELGAYSMVRRDLAMKLRLVERGAGKEEIRETLIDQPEFLIGRGADCDLRLRISSVSRHHCMIRLDSEEASVVDLGSSNGTFLNDNRVRSQTALHTGDILQVGVRRFEVALGDEQIDSPDKPEIDSIAVTVKVKASERNREGGASGLAGKG